METDKQKLSLEALNVKFDKIELYKHIDPKLFEQYVLSSGWNVDIERNGTRILSKNKNRFHLVVLHDSEDSNLPKYILASTFSDNVRAIVLESGKSEYAVIVDILSACNKELEL